MYFDVMTGLAHTFTKILAVTTFVNVFPGEFFPSPCDRTQVSDLCHDIPLSVTWMYISMKNETQKFNWKYAQNLLIVYFEVAGSEQVVKEHNNP